MEEAFQNYMKCLVMYMFKGDASDTDGQYDDWTLEDVIKFAEQLKQKEK